MYHLLNNLSFFLILLHFTPVNAQIIFVDQTAAGSATGASWVDAFPQLTEALAIAQPGDTIWVASGTYLPTTGNDRGIAFQPGNQVALYGGFSGVETALSERDWVNNPTILSGDIGQVAELADNSYRVLLLENTNDVTLDGFIVTGANNDFDSFFDAPQSGGGLFMNNASIRLINCEFTENQAIFGGAAALWAGAQIEVSQCRFDNNRATTIENRGGGAFYFDNVNSGGTFLNCQFSENRANTAGATGGAITGGQTIFTSCIFDSNEAAVGMAIGQGNTQINQCVFWGHQSGLHTVFESTAMVNNSIFWLNDGSFFDCTLELAGSLIPEVSCPDGATCQSMVFNENPILIDPMNDDFRIMVCSPAVDAGINANIPAGLTQDFDGLDRIIYGIVDMGPFEFLDLEPEFRPTDVTSTGDTYFSRTLRGAMACADRHPGPDTVLFHLAGPGPHEIQLRSFLPPLIDDETIIDATVGYELGDIVLIGDQLNMPGFINFGIGITGKAIEIYGLYFLDFFSPPIDLNSPSRNAQIGAPGKGNAFFFNPGNSTLCIDISGQGHRIQSNYFGFSPDGTSQEIAGTGMSFWPFTEITDIQIGGSRAAGEGNYFGNMQSVIIMSSLVGPINPTTNVRIQGNDFGIAPDGSEAPNNSCITLFSQVQEMKTFQIGGSADLSNRFGFNNSGIFFGETAQQITLAENSFYCNGNPLTVDDGSNGGILPPAITQLTFTEVSGTAGPLDRIEIYRSENELCPDNFFCQGTTLLAIVTTNADGAWSFTFDEPIGYDEPITATATDDSGNTSAFATCAVVDCPDSFSVINETLCPEDSIVVNGTVYNFDNPVGSEVLLDANALGCDSSIIVSLDFYPVATELVEFTLCAGESVTVNDIVYDEANPTGVQTLAGSSVNGCDSLLTVAVQFLESPMGQLNSVICPDESITVNGTIYDFNNPSGTETFPGAAGNGCDSLLMVNLSFFDLPVGTIDTTICEGESLDFDGQILITPGEYSFNFTSANGCDSTLTLTLSTLPALSTELAASICEGGTYDFLGTSLSEPGTYQEVLLSATGCDSLITLELSVLPTFEGFLDTVLCAGEQLTIGGDTFSSAGDFEVLVISEDGCDSLILLTLDYAITERPEATIEPDDGSLIGAILLQDLNMDLSINWDDGTTDNIRENLEAGIYSLTITDNEGCITTFDYEVPLIARQVEIPNAFTPNGDGVNDYFNVVVNVEVDPVLSFRVYNRWGQMVYDHEQPELGWDGRFEGEAAPSDVYFYQIEIVLGDGIPEVRQGEVVLLR